MSPYLLDTNKIDNTSSAAEKIREALAVYGPADDDAALRLWHTCREGNPECTENDVIHFIHVKGSLIQAREGRVYNPIGFLVTVVPKCLSGESFRDYREQQSQNRSRAEARQSEEEAALEIWRREQESRLSDPAVSAQEKHLIRLCLGLNGEQAQP